MDGHTLKQERHIHLNNRNDTQLDQSGELTIKPEFLLPIHIQLAKDTLELSRISFLETQPRSSESKPSHIFVLRNISNMFSEHFSFSTDFYRPKQTNDGSSEQVMSQPEESFIIGHESTPELGMSDAADVCRLRVRIGALAGYLHFMALDADGGAMVSVAKSDAANIVTPNRTFTRNPEGVLTTVEDDNGQWTRVGTHAANE